MTPTKLLIGQILVVFAIVTGALWSATQWTAARLAWQPRLGPSWFELAGTPVYPPWRLFEWWYAFEPYAPEVFNRGGTIAAAGGTVIAASLVTGIDSDLPGRVIAQVTANVYDTVTGRYLLIPQGSRLIGAYDSVIAFGQERALVVWQRIVMPDGSSVAIENLPATDAAGHAGLSDEVDFHTWRLLKGIVLSTLFGVGAELTFDDGEGDLVRALRESVQDNANTVGERLTERNLGIRPTVTVRPGWPLRVIVHSDLVLRPYGG